MTGHQSMWAKRSGVTLRSIFRSVGVRSAQSLTVKAGSANIPLTLTGKPNPVQITLWHNISLVGLIVCFSPVYNEIR